MKNLQNLAIFLSKTLMLTLLLGVAVGAENNHRIKNSLHEPQKVQWVQRKGALGQVVFESLDPISGKRLASIYMVQTKMAQPFTLAANIQAPFIEVFKKIRSQSATKAGLHSWTLQGHEFKITDNGTYVHLWGSYIDKFKKEQIFVEQQRFEGTAYQQASWIAESKYFSESQMPQIHSNLAKMIAGLK